MIRNFVFGTTSTILKFFFIIIGIIMMIFSIISTNFVFLLLGMLIICVPLITFYLINKYKI
jgi:hypothetical protein